MKLKFDRNTGDIIAIGQLPNLVPNNSDEIVEDYFGDIPENIAFFKRIAFNVLKKKTKEEIDEITNKEKTFNKQELIDFINSDGIPDASVIENIPNAKQQISLILKRQNKIIKILSTLNKSVRKSDIT